MGGASILTAWVFSDVGNSLMELHKLFAPSKVGYFRPYHDFPHHIQMQIDFK